MSDLDTIRTHQTEYFELLHRSARELSAYDGEFQPDRVQEFVAAASSRPRLVVPRAASYIPLALQRVQKLEHELHEFWARHYDSQRTAIRNLSGHCVLVDERLDSFLPVVSRYGVFFDHILVPEYLLLAFNTCSLNWASSLDGFLPILLNRLFLLLCNRRWYCPDHVDPIAIIAPGVGNLDGAVHWERSRRASDRALMLLSDLSDGSLSKEELAVPGVLRKTPLEVFERSKSLVRTMSGGENLSMRDSIRSMTKEMFRFAGGKLSLPYSDAQMLHMCLGGRLQTLLGLGGDGTAYSQDVVVNRHKWDLYWWLMRAETEEVGALLGPAASNQDIFRLALESDHFAWLSMLRPDQLLGLREQHTVQAIREDFRVGRCQIRCAAEDKLDDAVTEAGKYMSCQLEKHAEDLRRLKESKPWRLASRLAGAAVSNRGNPPALPGDS